MTIEAVALAILEAREVQDSIPVPTTRDEYRCAIDMLWSNRRWLESVEVCDDFMRKHRDDARFDEPFRLYDVGMLTSPECALMLIEMGAGQ